MILQHSSRHGITIILFNAKVGIFPLSCAVMSSVSKLFIAWNPTSFYKNILVYLVLHTALHV